MNAKIWKIENDETGVQISLFIGRPLAPSKTTYLSEEIEKFEEDRKAFEQELQRFTALHLGEVELIQEADQ